MAVNASVKMGCGWQRLGGDLGEFQNGTCPRHTVGSCSLFIKRSGILQVCANPLQILRLPLLPKQLLERVCLGNGGTCSRRDVLIDIVT